MDNRRRKGPRSGIQQGQDLAPLVLLILAITIPCAIMYQVGVLLGLWG